MGNGSLAIPHLPTGRVWVVASAGGRRLAELPVRAGGRSLALDSAFCSSPALQSLRMTRTPTPNGSNRGNWPSRERLSAITERGQVLPRRVASDFNLLAAPHPGSAAFEPNALPCTGSRLCMRNSPASGQAWALGRTLARRAGMTSAAQQERFVGTQISTDRHVMNVASSPFLAPRARAREARPRRVPVLVPGVRRACSCVTRK